MRHDTTDDHTRALIGAHRLLAGAPFGPLPPAVDGVLIRAQEQGWADVEYVVHHARYAAAELSGADMAGPLAAMEALAEELDDPAFLAVVAACQTQRDIDQLGLQTQAERRLAAAVALLDSDQGDGDRRRRPGAGLLHHPAARIECGLAYRALDLWELEEEMLDAAAAALRGPWPGAWAEVQVAAGRGLTLHRIEARAQRVCELLELGERQAAAELGALDDDLMSGTDHPEAAETAIGAVLAAAAGRPDPSIVIPDDGGWWWPGYTSCLGLAAAIRAVDAGDPVAAADRAEAALDGMDLDHLPALRLLALAIAADRPPVSAPARRYAREVVQLRAAARHRAVLAAQLQRLHELMRLRQPMIDWPAA